MKHLLIALFTLAVLSGTSVAGEKRAHLDTGGLPIHLQDRGEGLPLSMFGTYIQKRQLIVYPFFEYYRDHNYEYAPNELGFGPDIDYRGDYEASEFLLFVGYGLFENLALELEAAVISAELEPASDDPSGIPAELRESGIGDVEAQLRWRWNRETGGSPEVFSYFETVFPTQDAGSLIGTSDWEFKLGAGLIRGFSWGTMTLRAAAEYDRGEDAFGLGEMAVEYLRRLSGKWRVYGGVEGNEDEIELIGELQWHVSRGVFLKLNSGVGLTSKATGWAPEIGIVFTL